MMGAGLNVEVEHKHPVVVLRLRGVLTALTAPDLRSALLESVAGQPEAVVVDAAGLIVDEDIAVTVLATVAQQSESWPGTRIGVVEAGDGMADAMRRMGVARYVPLCADVAAAEHELVRTPAPPLSRAHIAADRNAPGVARAAVAEFCQTLGILDNDAAQLVASELVTNAVVHAGTPMTLTLRLLSPYLHIAVRDGGGGEPRISGIIDESSERGRGLLLVDALASRWGSFVPTRGKVVWATVRVKTSSDNGRAATDGLR